MRLFENKKNWLLFCFLVLSIFCGCRTQIEQPLRICPGRLSKTEALEELKLQAIQIRPLRASGHCRMKYYGQEEKPEIQNFPVRIWLNPPTEVYLQGDVAFNARGIILGANEDEFWLAVRPSLKSYWWGKWSDAGHTEGLAISPRTLLEALGVMDLTEQSDFSGYWALSSQKDNDVLELHGSNGELLKKIYIYNCDYTVRKIEYFDLNSHPTIVINMGNYRVIEGGFSIATLIRIDRVAPDGKRDYAHIKLNSVKSIEVSQRLRDRIFNKPDPEKYEYVYKIIGDSVIEQNIE